MQPGPSNRRDSSQVKIEPNNQITESHPYPTCNSNSSIPSNTSTQNSGKLFTLEWFMWVKQKTYVFCFPHVLTNIAKAC